MLGAEENTGEGGMFLRRQLVEGIQTVKVFSAEGFP
jgi:hypothetical protein